MVHGRNNLKRWIRVAQVQAVARGGPTSRSGLRVDPISLLPLLRLRLLHVCHRSVPLPCVDRTSVGWMITK